MSGIGEAKKEADGDCFDICLQQLLNGSLERCLVERDQYFAKLVETLSNLKAQCARHQGRLLLNSQIIEFWARLPADLKHIAKTGGCDQAGTHAFAFEYRVGCDCRAMHQCMEVLCHAKVSQALKDGLRGIIRSGEDFVNSNFTFLQKDKVGKCASSINSNE